MLLEERYKEKYDEGVADGIAKGVAEGVAKGVAETNQHRIEHYFRKGYSLEEAFNFFDDLPADTVKAVWESFKQSQAINS